MFDDAEMKIYVDVESGLSRVRGNKTIYKRMLQLFLQSEEFASFEAQLEAKDYQRASEVAHGIKGMTGNLGMPRIFEMSADLMVKLKDGPVDESIIDEYRDILEKTREYAKAASAELA
ncbi:MAG: Hpt domain-containing protein [Oscillospiraceae bacterium]|nr:Hpt domain-containing protein [Oscillospiraceae bacterium]